MNGIVSKEPIAHNANPPPPPVFSSFACRYGQTKPTFCYRLLAEGTMEQKSEILCVLEIC